MPKRKVIQVVEGEWLKWHKYERWVCCDCALVHRVEFRKHGSQIEIRMFRENRSTAAYRRAHGIELKNATRRHSKRSK